MGKRGEVWVLFQLVLFVAFFFAPPELRFTSKHSEIYAHFGFVAVILGGVLAVYAMMSLGRNLSPFPHPKPGGYLVAHGPYHLVRHPIYAGVLLIAAGSGLLTMNALRLALTLVLFLLFDVKSRLEEKWMIESYPEYLDYMESVRKRLIPWIY